MKKLLALLLTTAFVVAVHAAEFKDINITEVKSLSDSKSAVIIDVNGTESYNAGHVPGALNFDAIKGKLAASLPADKGALIVAYCGSPACKAYIKAAKAAEKLGYTNNKHMPAGISGWKEAGLKTEPGN